MKLFFTRLLLCCLLPAVHAGCHSPVSNSTTVVTDTASIRLITVDPGHFHAALVQKSMYPAIDSVVYVYAPAGPELQAHLALIKQYNTRAASPTRWVEKVYTGNDFLEKMIAEKKEM